MKFSFSLLFSIIFLGFIANSIWTLISLFQSPKCKEGEVCLASILNKKPDLDLLVFVSDSSRSGLFDLVLNEKKFDYSKAFERAVTVELSKTARENGSLFIHTLFVPSKANRKKLDFTDLVNEPDSTYLKSRLTKYAVPESATFNLLKDDVKKQNIRPVTHIKSKYSIFMCADKVEIPHNNIPYEIINSMRLNNKREFMPIVKSDVLNMRLKELVEITPQTKTTKIFFTYSPVSVGKLRFLLQIEATLYQFINLGFTEKDLDEVKGVFADTNLYLLCATLSIGSIHLLFDFLSFKNDVSFWKTQKSMAGLSSRTVLWRAFSQTVIFLYLLEEGTSLLVLIPSGIATLIEFWKVSKVLKTTFSWSGIKMDKDRKETNEEIQTRQYDNECMTYLSYVLYPLCFCGAVYSLMYQPHKSWYSWTINSLVNGVYGFGFIFMLPQLFINYRLKSVAALPWRAFTYRAFNTFIDDIFAFIITMPTAHRLACFRDDVVFIIYLYQRWLYPVDKSRKDENNTEAIEAKAEESIENKKKK